MQTESNLREVERSLNQTETKLREIERSLNQTETKLREAKGKLSLFEPDHYGSMVVTVGQKITLEDVTLTVLPTEIRDRRKYVNFHIEGTYYNTGIIAEGETHYVELDESGGITVTVKKIRNDSIDVDIYQVFPKEIIIDKDAKEKTYYMHVGDVLVFDTGKFHLKTTDSFTAKGPFYEHGSNVGSYVTLKQGYTPDFEDLKDHVAFGPAQVYDKSISMRIEYFQSVDESSEYSGFGVFHLSEKDKLIVRDTVYSFEIQPYPGGYLGWDYQVRIQSDKGSGWRCDGDSFYSRDIKAIMTLKVLDASNLQVTVSEYTPDLYARLDELRPGDLFEFEGVRFQVGGFMQAGDPPRKAVEVSESITGTGITIEAGRTRELGNYSITVHSIEEDDISRYAPISIE